MAHAPHRVAPALREHTGTWVDRRASKHATRSGLGQGVEANGQNKASGTGIGQPQGWALHPYALTQMTTVANKQTHRIEPDMKHKHHNQWQAANAARQPNRTK